MGVKLEIERKFIIRMPSISALEAMPEYTRSDITQIYLDAPAGVTHRVRSRCYGERTVYTETKKIRIDRMSAHEDEREIGKERFSELAAMIKPGTSVLKKTRHTFDYSGHTYEIDIYPDWCGSCILEVELEGSGEQIIFPDVISPVREVTGDGRYSNAGMARSFPTEDII